MSNPPRRRLTQEDAGRLYEPFPITSVCRADVAEALDITEQEAVRIDARDMEVIARAMADGCCYDDTFWVELPAIAEDVLANGGEA